MTGARSSFDWLMKPAGEMEEDEVRALAFNDEMTQEANRQLRELARLYLAVFGTPDGNALLELLREQTIEKPLIMVAGVIGQIEINIGPGEWAYYRDGQNSIVRNIETMLRLALRSENDKEEANA